MIKHRSSSLAILLRCLLTVLMIMVRCGTMHAETFSLSPVGRDFWETDDRNVQEDKTFTVTKTTPNTGLVFTLQLYLGRGYIKDKAFSVSNGRTGTLTVTAPSGYTISSVDLTWDNGRTGTATSSTTSTGIVLTISADNNEAQVEGITITYTEASDFTPWAAILSLRGGTYYGEQTGITITNMQDGVDYYYSKSSSALENWPTDWTESNTTWYKYDGHINEGDHPVENQYLNIAAVNHSDPTKVTYTHELYTILAITKAATPTFSLTGDTEYTGIQTLSITSADDDEDIGIFYIVSTAAIDTLTVGNSGWEVYTGPLTIISSCYVYAYADGEDYNASDIGNVHIIIKEDTKTSPGLKWVDSNDNEVTTVNVAWADKDNPTLPTLSNTHNLPVAYSITGENAYSVATIDYNGNITINGSGKVTVNATYTTTSSSEYSSQIASYELNVATQTDTVITFYSGESSSGGTIIAENIAPETDNVDSYDVPDGVVIKLDIQGYPSNSIVMAGVISSTDSKYPNYSTKKDGTIRNEEELDDDGHIQTVSNFQYLGRGIPIYSKDATSNSVYLRVRIYDPDNKKKALGQHIIQLNIGENANRPSPPTPNPPTYGTKGQSHAVLTLSESATVEGEEGATIYAKYSNSETYTPRVLLAEGNVSTGTTSTGIYSTVLHPDRRTTAIQVRHNQEWNGKKYDVASDVMEAYYYYTPNRKTVRLEAVNNPVALSITTTTANPTATLNVNCYIDGTKQDLPTAINGGKYNYTSSNVGVATVDADGNVTAVSAGTAIITVSTPQVDATIKQKKGNQYEAGDDGYDAAEVTFNIFVSDVAKQTLLPPTFSPATGRTYHAASRATVIANIKSDDTSDLAVGNAYYILFDDNTDYTSDDVTGESIVKAVTNSDHAKASVMGMVNVNSSYNVTIPTTHEDGTVMVDGDIYTLYAVTYNGNKTGNQYSEVVSVTFTYQTLIVNAPVLTPGHEGTPGDETTLYSFAGDNLTVTAATTTARAQVYYTVNSASDNVDASNGTLYSGDTRIVLSESAIVRAVAYLEGVYSSVVTYSYRKATPNIERPTFKIGGNTYSNGASASFENKAVVEILCKADVNQDGNNVDIAGYSDYAIYYTTDGTSPTSRSNVYSSGLTFQDNGTFTLWAFCKNTKEGATGPASKMTITITNGTQVWYTNETTCPKGVLAANVISQSEDNANQSYAPADITITIGRSGQEWSNQEVAETYKGNRIDGFGMYDIVAKGSLSDADDELGVLYNHAYAQGTRTRAKGVYESTFKLPSHGTFVKFEPQKDGNVTIWCEQNGGMHYSKAVNNEDHFYSQFIRLRPVYFVDEQGNSIQYSSVDAAGTLNPLWSQIDESALLGMNGIQDGLPQTLFTQDEAKDIYEMYKDKIDSYDILYPNNTASRNIRGLVVTLNDGTHTTAANAPASEIGAEGDNVEDGTGYCIPSASYMKYVFPVKAGKTYFFFARKTKIGISALGFRADDTQNRQEVTIDGTNVAANTTAISSAISTGTTAKVTVNRDFTAEKWAAIVLPFSMSATQVQATFGNGTLVQHYYGYESGSPISYINLTQHDHQMIVAGTPVFILPKNTMSSFTIDGVQIEKSSIEDVADQNWGSSVKMTGSYDYSATGIPQWSFYVQDGALVQAKSGSVAQKATRAWLEGLSSAAKVKIGTRGDATTGIETVNDDASSKADDDTVYSVSGMVMGKGGETISRLPAGVYIYHGKKFVRK